MLNIIVTLLISFSLALFCLGTSFYVNLHLGYEFVATAISLQIAAFFFAVALSKTEIRIKTDTLALAALLLLMASAYLLFAVDYAGLPGYLNALTCFVLPVVALGLCVVKSSTSIPLRITILSVFIGIIAGIVVAFMVLEREGLWMIFSLSAAALMLSILLMADTSTVTKIATLGLLIGGVLLINNGTFSNQLASWSLSGNPVSKPSINMLQNPDQHNRSLDSTSWSSTGRRDIISSNLSRNKGYVWILHNAGLSIPFVDDTHASITWWKKNYPLMVLPFEIVKPKKVMTIAAAKGPEVDVSQQLYSAETMSIYKDCTALEGSVPCDMSSLYDKLYMAFNSHDDFDLVFFSMPYKATGPYVGTSISYEAIHTMEVFQKLFDKLSDNGLLVVTVTDQVILNKTLSYVWRTLSNDSNDKIINFEKNIRVLQQSNSALNKDSYNYLVLVSKQGFTKNMLHALNDYVRPAPIIKVIYDSINNIPPYIFFKQLDKITISDAILHLTRASSWGYKKLINLEPSTLTKPNYFHLAIDLHPFVATLSALFLFSGIYGLIFSRQSMRRWVNIEHQNSPALSILLFQSLLCTIASALIFYFGADFSSASLGYASRDSSILMLLALVFFALPYVVTGTEKIVSNGGSGIWFYLVILLLLILIVQIMAQDIEVLFGTGAKILLFILVAVISFCFGLAHYQSILFAGKFYPGVWFWSWYMTSIGTVLGVIIAQFISIKFNLISVVHTATVMFLILTIIAWWCVLAAKDRQVIEVGANEIAS